MTDFGERDMILSRLKSLRKSLMRRVRILYNDKHCGGEERQKLVREIRRLRMLICSTEHTRISKTKNETNNVRRPLSPDRPEESEQVDALLAEPSIRLIASPGMKRVIRVSPVVSLLPEKATFLRRRRRKDVVPKAERKMKKKDSNGGDKKPIDDMRNHHIPTSSSSSPPTYLRCLYPPAPSSVVAIDEDARVDLERALEARILGLSSIKPLSSSNDSFETSRKAYRPVSLSSEGKDTISTVRSDNSDAHGDDDARHVEDEAKETGTHGSPAAAPMNTRVTPFTLVETRAALSNSSFRGTVFFQRARGGG